LTARANFLFTLTPDNSCRGANREVANLLLPISRNAAPESLPPSEKLTDPAPRLESFFPLPPIIIIDDLEPIPPMGIIEPLVAFIATAPPPIMTDCLEFLGPPPIIADCLDEPGELAPPPNMTEDRFDLPSDPPPPSVPSLSSLSSLSSLVAAANASMSETWTK
jgi:hypothetical protein